MDDADWFLKADDDTYVIVENLRFMLYPYSPNDPLFFGANFKGYTSQGYMDGGPGYVLSKEAVKKFVEEAMPNENLCRKQSDGPEDIHIGNQKHFNSMEYKPTNFESLQHSHLSGKRKSVGWKFA